MCKLQGDRRWAVTGSPVHNSLEDLATIFEFLKACPFDNRKTFLTEIIKPLKSGEGRGLARLKVLIGATTLRRTSQLLNLPTTLAICRNLQFNPAEKRAYNDTKSEAVLRMKTADIKNTSFSIMHLITKLRQMCNHGLLGPKMRVDTSLLAQLWNPGNAQEAFLLMLDNDAAQCSVCGRNIGLLSPEEAQHNSYHELYKCLYLRCDQCLAKISARETEDNGCVHIPKCPSHQVCNLPPEKPTTLLDQPEFTDGPDPEQMPTKVRALVDGICESGLGEKRSESS